MQRAHSSRKDFEEIRKEFIAHWREAASSWGIPPAMASIHGLLLSHAKPVTTDDVMDALDISRGSAHTQLQGLVEWGLVYSLKVMGTRQVTFLAEKDPWQMMICIARERRKRELQPLLSLSDWSASWKDHCEEPNARGLAQTLQAITDQAQAVDAIMSRVLVEDERWWEQWFLRSLRRN